MSSPIDLAAVVFYVGPLQVINCQDGRTRSKRNVTLIDESYNQISLGLWPEFTDALNDFEGRAVIFQNLQLTTRRSFLKNNTVSAQENPR